MKITLGSKTLLEKLQSAAAVIPASSTLPILQNVLFDVNGDELTLVGTDLETTIEATIKMDKGADGQKKIALPARLLQEILKAFPDQPLTFEVLDNSTVEISSADGKYAIAYVDGNEFPRVQELAEPVQFSISSKALATAISRTIFAAGDDALRPVMTGVLFQMSETGTNFVATDAHKLVKYTRKDVTAEEKTEFIVPKKPLSVLKSLLSGIDVPVIVKYNGSNAQFELEGYTITCRLVDGKYPNYEAVIPTENPNVMMIDRDRLLASVRCVSIFSNKMTHQVKFALAGSELKISAEDVDYSQRADERLTCDYQGGDMQIGFNSRFLLEMLNNTASEQVTLEMSLPERAGILRPSDGLSDEEDLLMLVMPVKLSK